jgi:hypothetical protein
VTDNEGPNHGDAIDKEWRPTLTTTRNLSSGRLWQRPAAGLAKSVRSWGG